MLKRASGLRPSNPTSSTRWRGAARGIHWVGFGTFLLLTTLGYLPWSFWLELLAYWPILLVALGLRLMFQGSAAPALVLLSPVLVLGTMAWVAVDETPYWPGDWVELKAERPQGVDRWILGGSLAAARFEVTSAELPEEILIDGRAITRARNYPRVSTSRNEARVSVGGWHRSGIHVAPSGRSRWDLELTQSLPVELDLDLAVTSGVFDLSHVPVSRIDVDGALNDVTLRLGSPKADVNVWWEGAFNSIELVVPEQTPVRISTDGFINITDRRSHARNLKGPGYRVRMDGAFNRVTIRSE